MLYRPILLLAFFFYASITYCQIEIGGRLNIGASKISNDFTAIDSEHEIDFGPSFLIGVYLDKSLNVKTSISTELILQYFSGSEHHVTQFVDGNGSFIGNRNGTDSKKITYLMVPFYYGFKMNKITINAGLQAGVVVGSGGRSTATGFNGTTPIFFNNQIDKLKIQKFNFGPRIGILFRLSDLITIDGNYYFGLNNIATSEIPWEWKIYQFSFGLRYQFQVENE